MLFVNVLVMFAINPYSGILRRRYYLQVEKEVALTFFQICISSILFYLLKIGSIFSRQMFIVTYGLYFILSQTSKYIWKKKLTGELFNKDNINKVVYVEQEDDLEEQLSLDIIEEKSKLMILFQRFVKRTVDILAGIVGCIILIPLAVVVFILNRLNDEDGPLFYVQDRIGKDGKLFSMLKFRTMVMDADDKLEEFLKANPEIKEEFMIYRKIKNDPRVTKIGKFLRSSSIDEWPQFISILTGKMSLVGPRPYLSREKEQMGRYYKIIIKDKPGLTGLWQTEGRSDVTFEDRIELDIKYHKKKSLFEDIRILFNTFLNVICKKGAI